MERRQEETGTGGSANEVIDALAALGQQLLELQGAVAEVNDAAAEDPEAVQLLQDSEQRVADMHLRAWASAAGFGDASANGRSPAHTGERSAQ